MDPQTTWDDLLAAYAAEQWDQLQELADGLLTWIERGGFAPRATTGDDMGQEWDRAIALAACRFALSKVEEAATDDAS